MSYLLRNQPSPSLRNNTSFILRFTMGSENRLPSVWSPFSDHSHTRRVRSGRDDEVGDTRFSPTPTPTCRKIRSLGTCGFSTLNHDPFRVRTYKFYRNHSSGSSLPVCVVYVYGRTCTCVCSCVDSGTNNRDGHPTTRTKSQTTYIENHYFVVCTTQVPVVVEDRI